MALGYGLSTIGLGEDFDLELMRELAELGGGAFYFVEDEAALAEVFTEEVDTLLVPLAEDVRIELDATAYWELRSVYGTTQVTLAENAATIEIPRLQIAHRTSAGDTTADGGRRGGGGAIITELLPVGNAPPGQVASVRVAYTDVATGEQVLRDLSVESAVSASDGREEGWFYDEQVEKGFVMLNLYVGFRMAAVNARDGRDDAALAILYPLRDNVDSWLLEHSDADIADDNRYVQLFIDNLHARQDVVHVPESVPDEP